MKRRHLIPTVATALIAATSGANGAADAAGSAGARDATLNQCAADVAACRQMLVQLLEIQNVTQQQAANASPQIVSAGGGPISVGGIRQCQTNSQN